MRPLTNRRDFIRISAGAGGGLLVGMSLPSCFGPARDDQSEAVSHTMDLFLEIDERGFATVRVPVPEIGQGIRTSMAMLVAEELDVPWDRVRVEQGSTHHDMGPRPYAGGSWSIHAHWLPLRRSGAAARQALLNVAARRWGFEPEDLTVENGVVTGPDMRRAGYGELAAEAAIARTEMALDPDTVALKQPSVFRLIGTHVAQLDTPAIVRGEMEFGLDVRRPGMLRACIARSAVYGGKLLSFDDSACQSVRGFVKAVAIEAYGNPDRPYSGAGVAVIAETTWGALQARERLQVEWDTGVNEGEDSDLILRDSRARLASGAQTFREEGDLQATFETAALRVSAEYSWPFIVHAPMEPMNCVVHHRGDSIEIWAPTQVPLSARTLAARVSDLEPEQVTVHVTRSGGGFGRRLAVDFVVEAVLVARTLDVPVQVMWTREDDMRHGWLRPLNAQRLEASVGESGKLLGWLHRQAGTSRYAFRDGQPFGESEFRAGTWPAALAEAHRLEYALIQSNLPRGALRAPGLNTYYWATECFLSEVARASGQDPLGFRLGLLGEPRDLPYDEEGPFSTERMAGVFRRAAEMAGWGGNLPPGRGQGIAGGFTFGTYVAHVAEVSVDRDRGRVVVHRVVSAVDCGRVVNLNGATQQVQGGVLDALGACLHGQIDVRGGAVVQSNFDDFPLLRIEEAPDVEVHWVQSGADPSGLGEPPYPPLAPAVGNALFNATGIRIRDLPFHSEHNRELLRTTPE